jgi:hypothetical protein
MQKAKSPAIQDRLELASSTDVPDLLIGSLVNDVSNKVRVAALSNPLCPKESAMPLANDPEPAVRLAIAKSKNFDNDLCEKYLQDTEEIRLAALSNGNINPNYLYHYANSSSMTEKVAIAKNPSCPTDLQAKLAAERSEEINQAIAQNPSASPEILLQILSQADRNIIVNIPDGKPVETLAKIFQASPQEMYEPMIDRLLEIKKTVLLADEIAQVHRALTASCFEKIADKSVKQQNYQKISKLYQHDQEMLDSLFNHMNK